MISLSQRLLHARRKTDTGEKCPRPQRDSNPLSKNQAALDLRIRPQGQRDRPFEAEIN